MEHLPYYISMVFILTTLYAVFIFWKASLYDKIVLAVLAGWLAIQGIIASTLFYTNTNAFPPRFLLLILPAFTTIAALFFTRKGKGFLQRLDTSSLILLHIVRVPVEIVLFWLFLHKGIPQVMTFEGNNFDILSGISAPIIWLLNRQSKNTWLLLGWNIACLALLINIVTTAILAAPTPLQQIAFDQPNIAVTYFPFVWLPCCVVPLVMLSHLVMIWKAVKKLKLKSENTECLSAGAK